MLKPKTAFLKFLECIKVVKYAVKIVQISAGMHSNGFFRLRYCV